MNIVRKLTLPATLAVAMTFAACSDNVDQVTAGPSGPSDSVPDSAGLSTTAFIDFLLTMANGETSEPLTIRDGFAVPADETGDARPLV